MKQDCSYLECQYQSVNYYTHSSLFSFISFISVYILVSRISKYRYLCIRFDMIRYFLLWHRYFDTTCPSLGVSQSSLTHGTHAFTRNKCQLKAARSFQVIVSSQLLPVLLHSSTIIVILLNLI